MNEGFTADIEILKNKKLNYYEKKGEVKQVEQEKTRSF